MIKYQTLINLVLLVILTSFDYILYIKWISSMKNYKWYAGSLVFPVTGAIYFYVPLMIKKFYYHKDFSTEFSFKQKPLFFIGTLDSINSILGTYATPYLSVVVMTLVDKITLPLTMLVSYYYLRSRYRDNHYLGCFLTIYGIMVSFLPELINPNYGNIYWLCVYIVSIIPGVLSYCYKEAILKNNDLDIWWLNTWISVWQILFGILTFPMLFAPLPSGEDLKIEDLGNYFDRASKCQFLGENSNLEDNCNYSLLYLFVYQVISTLTNVLMFNIIRDESSVVFIIINMVKMPVTAFLGSFHELVGDSAENINIYDVFSFIMIGTGIMVYNYRDEIIEGANKGLRSSSSDLVVNMIDEYSAT